MSAGGEKCLLSYRQERAAEHVQPSQILEALGIPQAEVLPSNLASDVHCSDDVCTKN